MVSEEFLKMKYRLWHSISFWQCGTMETGKNMRIWKKKMIKLAVLTGILCMGLGSVSAEAAKKVQADFSDFAGSNEDMAGGTVAPKLTYEKEEDTLRLSFDTKGYQERYYTATAFKNIKLDTEEFAGLSFEVRNNCDTAVRMNFALFEEEGRTIDVGAGFYVRLQGPEVSYAKVEYGCFELPPGFAGRVEIPFRILAFQDTGERAGETAQIWGYGMICVAQQEEIVDLSFTGLSFLTAEETVDAGEACELEIEGEDRAFRPKVGESNTPYQAVVYNMLGEGKPAEAVFSLKAPCEQAEISAEGVLTVGSKCREETLELKAETAEGLTAVRKIEVYDSWTNSVSTDNGFDASLADPSEIAPIVTMAQKLRSPRTLWLIRGAFVAGGALFLIYYLMVRRKNRSGK